MVGCEEWQRGREGSESESRSFLEEFPQPSPIYSLSRLPYFVLFEYFSRMGTNDAAKIPMHSGDAAEDSETTVEIKIKTLDSQTHTLRVNKCVSVPALKEQIATITGVLSEQQRLICRGRVLKDDQLLSAYHVEDGHTLHLVVRQPYQSSSPFIGYEGLSGLPANSAPDSMPNHSNQVSRTVVLETVNIGQGDVDSTVLGRIVENILNSFGPTISGIGNVRAEYQEANSDRLPRPFGDIGVSGTENQPNIGSQRMESNWQHATFRFPSAVSSLPQTLPAIPHSLTTLRQYIDHLMYEFRREMPGSTDRDHTNSGEASTMHHNDGEDLSQSHQSCRRDDLPTPVVLAEILQTARQLLAEQAEESLLRLSRELENHTSVTDPQMRTNVQSSAIRTGFILQNLGSLLLELGRTTMTLHMGQMPSEAIVNAGPAVFISASGPNPVMVQPVPFYPAPSFRGAHMGSTNSGHGHDGEGLSSAFFPRNIDIRIHAVPLPAGSHSGQSGAQQQHENSDPARSSAHQNSVHQIGPGHPGNAPLTGEYGVRVVPVRTVVAMPAGLSNSQSNLSGNSAALLYPLLASIRQQNSGSANNTPGSQASPSHQQGGIEQSQAHIPDSIRQILESYIGGSTLEENPASSYTVPVVSGTNAQVEHQGSRVFVTSHRMTPNGYNERSSHIDDGQDARQGFMPQFASGFEQWSRTFLGEQINTGGGEQQGPALCSGTEQTSIDRETELNEASRSVNDQGVLFSNFLRQVMPLIMQGTAREQGVSRANQNPLTFESQRESSNGASSSQHQRDPPEAPSQKRHKGE